MDKQKTDASCLFILPDGAVGTACTAKDTCVTSTICDSAKSKCCKYTSFYLPNKYNYWFLAYTFTYNFFPFNSIIRLGRSWTIASFMVRMKELTFHWGKHLCIRIHLCLWLFFKNIFLRCQTYCECACVHVSLLISVDYVWWEIYHLLATIVIFSLSMLDLSAVCDTSCSALFLKTMCNLTEENFIE